MRAWVVGGWLDESWSSLIVCIASVHTRVGSVGWCLCDAGFHGR